MNKSILGVFVVLLLLSTSSGCFGDNESVHQIISQERSETSYWNDSFQFQNMVGASYANSTQVNITHNGSMDFDIELMVYFSDAIVWNGHLNLSIYEGVDNESVWLWSNETTSTGVKTLWWDFNTSTNASNMTITVRATGMDSEPENDMADYFVMYLTGTNRWMEEVIV